MNLRSVDLNLLVAFDALIRTRHVTRAAKLLGIGQPGMSAALTRLRQLFEDDLLVKQGAHMVPTARALALEPELHRILREVEHILEDKSRFHPATTKRTFRLRMSDLLSFLLLPELMPRIVDAAPSLKLDVVHLAPEATVDALERNHVELAVSTGLATPKSIEYQALFSDHVVGISRPGRQSRRRLRNIEDFVAMPQIRISQSPLDDRFVDRQLAVSGRTRNVVLTVPHWLAVPKIVAHSHLIAVMPASIARRMARAYGLHLFVPPLDGGEFEWGLYWHRRHSSDSGHQWLRQTFAALAGNAVNDKKRNAAKPS